MLILGIDPGKSVGMVLYDADARRVLAVGESASERVPDIVAIEWVEPRAQPLGKDLLATIEQACHYECAWRHRIGHAFVVRVTRVQARQAVCGDGSSKIGDPHIRQRLLDLHGGGSARLKASTRAKGHPLYGVSGHHWAALAVAWCVVVALAEVPA